MIDQKLQARVPVYRTRQGEAQDVDRHFRVPAPPGDGEHE
jgi:hypothetical protein